MFRGHELLRIGKRVDRTAKERADEAGTPTVDQRTEAVEGENRRGERPRRQ
jgi:hypothetical protein